MNVLAFCFFLFAIIAGYKICAKDPFMDFEGFGGMLLMAFGFIGLIFWAALPVIR